MMSSMAWLLLAVTTGYLTCGCQCHRVEQVAQMGPSDAATEVGNSVLPTKGAASTLDIASWNLEWFGDTSNGPVDEARQLRNAHAVIASSDMDIWGLAEIVNLTQWTALTSRLPGYTGLLASDLTVTDGKGYYQEGEQKVGVLYKTGLATLEDARLILTERERDYAGRPPLQITLRVTLNELTQNVVIIVIHAKCCMDTTSWQQRVNASSALKTYLDGAFPTQKVWVIGDFNDDIDTSITADHPSPYANFVEDAADYDFATRILSDSRIASTVEHEETIDHHLETDEAGATYIPGSAESYRVDGSIADYRATTSDHYPVLSRYRWAPTAERDSSGDDYAAGRSASIDAGDASSAGLDDAVNIVINEIGANEVGTDTGAEFVEVVNRSSRSLDIAGWTLSDATRTRHVFATGTHVAPGKAIVVFGSSTAIAAGLSNAVAASTGSLNLANSGDTIVLANASGTEIDSCSYSPSLADVDGVSMNRTPDGSRNRAFVLHSILSALSLSPGTRVDGSAW